MSAADRLPDWGAPVPGGDGGLWLADGDPSRALAVPVALALIGDDGRPGYALDMFKVNSHDALDMFGVLTLRFMGAYRLDARQAAVTTSGLDVRLAPLPITDGFVRFIASDALALPGLDAAQPLHSAGAGAKLTVRLSGVGIQAFQRIGGAGAAPVTAQVIVAVPGMAMCAPARAKVDGTALASLLDASEGGLWTLERLAAAIADGTFGVAIELDVLGDPQERAGAAGALADRLVAQAFELTPAATPEPAPLWKRRQGALAGKRLMIDLSDATITPRAFRLVSEPLLPPSMAMHEVEDDGAAAMFDTGLQLVTIDANLPADRVGAAAITVDLAVPAAPPDRPQSITRTLRLDNHTGPQAIALRLAPHEALSFAYRTSVMAVVGGGAERLTGPELANDDAQLTLPPDAFAVDFLRIEATDALLAAGTVKLEWSGEKDGHHWQTSTELSRARPAIAVARPRDLEALKARATLVSPDGGARLEIPDPGTGALWLDLADVPQAGPQTAKLCATFGPDDKAVVIEYVAEDDAGKPDAPVMLRLTPDAPEVTFRWLPTSPFRSGFRCRWAAIDGEPGDWSPVQATRSALTVLADQSTAWPGGGADGDSPAAKGPPVGDPDVELLAAGDHRYFYRARAPQLQRGDDGKPAIHVVDAGTSHFLQLTAVWSVPSDRIDAIAAALAERDGAPPMLSPTGDAVASTAFLLANGGGDLQPIATGTALGMPPQTSLLTATLDDTQAAILRRAMTGERGLAVVRYAIDAIDPAGATSTTSERHDDGAGSSRTTTASQSRSWRHSMAAEADLADLIAS